MSKLVPISLSKIMQSSAYTVFVLGNSEKQFAIYTEPHVGINLQLLLSDETRPRPDTHSLIHSIFSPLNINVTQIVINNVDDTIYFARLFLEQALGSERKILEVDARPSDALTLALHAGAPLFCKQEIFEKVVPIPPDFE